MKKSIAGVGTCLVFLGMFFLSQDALAGVVIEELVREREGDPSVVFLYFSDHQFRTDHQEKGLTTIMDFKKDHLMMIDHRSKNYVEVPLSKWEREVTKGLKREQPGIKPKTREITVRKTEEKAVINGFQTEKVEIFADGELIEENWVTRDVDMREVERVMEKVAQGFSKDFKIEMEEGRKIYEKLKPYGFPILIRDYTMAFGLKAVDKIEVRRLENKRLSDEVFSPPKDYRKIVPKTSKK